MSSKESKAIILLIHQGDSYQGAMTRKYDSKLSWSLEAQSPYSHWSCHRDAHFRQRSLFWDGLYTSWVRSTWRKGVTKSSARNLDDQGNVVPAWYLVTQRPGVTNEPNILKKLHGKKASQFQKYVLLELGAVSKSISITLISCSFKSHPELLPSSPNYLFNPSLLHFCSRS